MLDRLVLACLAKKPEARPKSAEALHDALEACARVAPWNAAEAREFWRAFRNENVRMRTIDRPTA